jgi:serine/threonine protein kinase
MNEQNKKENLQIHHYIIQTDIIAKGGFGTIYRGKHKRTGEVVAVKTESHANTTLRHETRMLQYLYENGVRKIPAVYWYGVCELFCDVKSQVLILPFFVCNLETYIQHKPMTASQLAALTIKCLDIVQQIHAKFVVHRDIKPANFMIKNGDIYLIDFGLATFYLDQYSQHREDNDTEKIGTMVGTAKYASLNIHQGHRYSRRDDIISLIYMYDYMKKGGVISWGIKDPENDKISDQMPTENVQYIGERTDIGHPVNQQWLHSKYQYLLALSADSDAILLELYQLVYAVKYGDAPDYSKIKLLLQTI